jgi:hypothetical protein
MTRAELLAAAKTASEPRKLGADTMSICGRIAAEAGLSIEANPYDYFGRTMWPWLEFRRGFREIKAGA